MTPEARISVLVARYGVSRCLARVAVYRGIDHQAAQLADRDTDPRAGFIAAVNALCLTRRDFTNPSADALTNPERTMDPS
jgi:hypothetical protein